MITTSIDITTPALLLTVSSVVLEKVPSEGL